MITLSPILLITTPSHDRFMPTGLKSTSSPIQISSQIRATASAVTQFLSKRVDLQLNPLDNEVFVVTGIKIDFTDATPIPDVSAVGVYDLEQACSVSKTELPVYQGINSNSVIAEGRVSGFLKIGAAPDQVQNYVLHENDAMDAPPATQDYLDIIATNDFHINFNLSAHYNLGADAGANVRLYGYRATASSSVYAALVQSEMLSS